MLVPFMIIAVAFFGVCFLVYFKIKKQLTVALFVKTGTSVLFIALALLGTLRLDLFESGLSTLALFVLIGLVFGLLGDIWLDLKSIHKEHKLMYLLAGFTSFGIGHLFFFAGLFVYLGGADASLLLWPIIGALAMALFIYFTEKPLKMSYGEVRRITLAYTFVITASMIMAMVLTLDSAVPQYNFTFVFSVGMVLFLCSDLVLSQTYFSERRLPEGLLLSLNYLLYYGGQFTIALSLFAIQPV